MAISKIYHGLIQVDPVAQTVQITGLKGGTGAGVPVAITAAGAVTVAAHNGRALSINSAAGIAITLPAATGSGAIYDFVVGVTITSGSTTIVSPASNFLAGTVLQAKVGTSVLGYAANGTSHRTITMDGSTRGGIIGDRIKIRDLAAGLYALEMVTQATGVVATPIS